MTKPTIAGPTFTSHDHNHSHLSSNNKYKLTIFSVTHLDSTWVINKVR